MPYRYIQLHWAHVELNMKFSPTQSQSSIGLQIGGFIWKVDGVIDRQKCFGTFTAVFVSTLNIVSYVKKVVCTVLAMSSTPQILYGMVGRVSWTTMS